MLENVSTGQVLGRYELLLPIAQGGMASVWAARLKGTRGFQKMVAIKTMLPGLLEDSHFERMFLDEATLASGVRHPHVVEILDLGDEDGVLYLVMEWVDGEPLSTILKYAATRGGVPISIAIHIATQACRGLHAAHELRDENGALVGLVHRDVSPQNVLVTYDGVVKLVDFGVAKATARAATSETEAGQLKGKIAYMSPEQLRGDKLDRRVDVFAMGILLYMMTTGKHPFRGDDQSSTISSISSDDPVIPPSEIVPGFPLALEQVLMLSLAKDPAKRYPTANDMLIGLTRALPPTMRAATDEEVAEFLRRLLPDRLEKRKLAIKAALELADRRESGLSSSRLNEGADEAPTVLEGLVSNRELTPTGDAASLPGAASSRPPSMYGEARRKRRRRALLGVAVVLGGIASGVVLVSALFRPSRPAPEPPSAARAAASVVVSAMPEAVPAVPALSVAATPPDTATAEPAPSTTVAPRAAPNRRAPKPAPKPAAKKGKDAFVSPIRNPGF